MPTTDDAPSDDFFESLMADYTDAWNREDIDAIEAFYHHPFFSYQDGALGVYSDPVRGREIDLGWPPDGGSRSAGPARATPDGTHVMIRSRPRSLRR
jgi:hypothetical protein